ncbi:hypothetical protein HPB50_029001 [Hyalomma asiaticum]|nr:hypothetical protein HPB50_029001 [Hyalomma asiaticum]
MANKQPTLEGKWLGISLQQCCVMANVENTLRGLQRSPEYASAEVQVAHFSRLGGSLQDALRQLMRRYMADTLAQEFSLTGRKGKRSFNTLLLLQVITSKII